MKIVDTMNQICQKCHHKDSDCWNKSYCYLIPDFGIDTNGQLELLCCQFVNWTIQRGWSTPKGKELSTTNGYKIVPPMIWYAISIVSEEGISNLVKRYEDYLEKVRDSMLLET